MENVKEQCDIPTIQGNKATSHFSGGTKLAKYGESQGIRNQERLQQSLSQLHNIFLALELTRMSTQTRRLF